MDAEQGAAALVRAHPPQAAPGPGVPYEMTIVRLDNGRAQIVRAYTCPVCGYVEMYDVSVVEPGAWGAP